MGNLNLLGSVRNVYSQPGSFNYHQTTKHKVQSSLPDVIKAMWFCLRNQFFNVAEGRIALELPLRSTGEVRKVRKSLIEVLSKGEEKVSKKLEEKLHESFPLFRFTSLASVMEEVEETGEG